MMLETKNMEGKRGIDVSENNGHIDWWAVKEAGIDFAIIRLGYGNCHLDSRFYANVNGALDAGLEIGVYYYSYALSVEAAKNEANFLVDVLLDCGLPIERLTMGVFIDMEDADGYKARHGALDGQLLTGMCGAFLDVCYRRGFDKCGVYSSYDWLENRLDTFQWGDSTIIWCDQWDEECDWDGAALWQYTDELEIDGQIFDGNICMVAEV